MDKSNKCLWEILVPTQKNNPAGKNKYYTLRYHRLWDEKVRKITGGLTIMTPAKGQWVSPSGDLFVERMIPVRIMCTADQIEEIADMTAAHYNQLAIFYYLVSNFVKIKYYDKS
jgi:hypothetical protein